jgi:hypothetical protein
MEASRAVRNDGALTGAKRRPLHLWRDALWESDATALEKVVGHAMSRWMNTDTLETFVGYEKIAARAGGISEKSVHRAIFGDPRRPDVLPGLSARGLLELVERGGHHRGDSHRYRGTFPKADPRSTKAGPRVSGRATHGLQNSALDSAVDSPDWPGDDIPF